MKRILFVLLVIAFSISSISAFAKCYNFRDSNGISVCVKGDSFSDRKRAAEICKKAKGSDCGNITSYSSSCHSNAGKCYDESGKATRSLRGY